MPAHAETLRRALAALGVAFLLGTASSRATPPSAPPEPDKALSDLQEIAAVLPSEIVPATRAGWTDVKISAANDVLQAKVKNRLGRFTFRIDKDSVKLVPGDDNKSVLVLAAPEKIIGTQSFQLTCRCPDTLKSQLATLNPGDVVTITAKIMDAHLERKDEKVPLLVNGTDVTIETIVRSSAASQPAIAATTTAPSSQPAAYTLQSLTSLIPNDVAPPRGGSWTAAKAQAAQDAMAGAKAKPARMVLTIDSVQNGGETWTVSSSTLTDKENGATAQIILNVKDTRLAALVSKGQTIIAEGNIANISVQLADSVGDRQMVAMRFVLDVTAIPAGGPVPKPRPAVPPMPPIPASNGRSTAPRAPGTNPPANQVRTFNF